MVDVRGSTFSFSFENRRGLLETGVESSSIEVKGEAVLVVSAPEVTRVIEVAGIAGEPLPVMRTIFFPIFDSGSSFFALILAYMSLLNLVVISTRGMSIKKKKSVLNVKAALTSLRLTLFSFNVKIPQDEGRGLRTETIKSKSPWIHKAVTNLNCARVLNSLSHSFFVPALQLRPSLNYAKQETGESVATTVNKIKLKVTKRNIDAPKFEVPHRRCNLRNSPQTPSEGVSKSSPDTKKNLDFQYLKDEGNPLTILVLLS